MSIKWFIIFVLAIATGVLGFSWWKNKNKVSVQSQPTNTAPPAPKNKQWTPEDIAKNPEGYLVWSQDQIKDQIKGREQKLTSLSTRRDEVVAKQRTLVDKVRLVENFNTRLKAALQKSEDEDRWPVRMAGKTYRRDEALGLIETTRQWVEDNRGLADAYDSALAKMDSTAGQLKGDIEKLQRLNDKLALDLEKVKLNQGLAEMENLRQTGDQLASMGNTLSQMSEQQAPVLPAGTKSDRIDIDAIVK